MFDTVPNLQCGHYVIRLDVPRIMAIVNVTPDSFSDGGQHADASQALRHAEQLLREGADILDIGAESTRPGAEVVPLASELARLEPFFARSGSLASAYFRRHLQTRSDAGMPRLGCRHRQ